MSIAYTSLIAHGNPAEAQTPERAERLATMAHNFSVGSVVVNFGVTAKVVALFTSAHGQVEETGWPILKAIGRDGKARGGKWLADPSKCQEVA